MNKTFLSFGTGCPSGYQIKKRYASPTYFFDWIGCNIDSIKIVSEFLIEKNYSFLTPENLVFKDKYFVHKDLYLLFGHENEKEQIDIVSERLIRRFNRTSELLYNNKVILLCYICEKQKIPKIEDTEYIVKTLKTENNDISLRVLASENRIKEFLNQHSSSTTNCVAYTGLPEISSTFEWTRNNLDWSSAFV